MTHFVQIQIQHCKSKCRH